MTSEPAKQLKMSLDLYLVIASWYKPSISVIHNGLKPQNCPSSRCVSAIVGGLITGVISPYVAWGVEKRREKLKARRDQIAYWREKIKIKDFNRESFRETTGYSTLRPYLTTGLIAEIERPGTELMTTNTSPDRRTQLKAKVLDEISEIERKWKLID